MCESTVANDASIDTSATQPPSSAPDLSSASVRYAGSAAFGSEGFVMPNCGVIHEPAEFDSLLESAVGLDRHVEALDAGYQVRRSSKALPLRCPASPSPDR